MKIGHFRVLKVLHTNGLRRCGSPVQDRFIPQVVIKVLANVQQVTIEPIIKATIAAGSLVYTDEYDLQPS